MATNLSTWAPSVWKDDNYKCIQTKRDEGTWLTTIATTPFRLAFLLPFVVMCFFIFDTHATTCWVLCGRERSQHKLWASKQEGEKLFHSEPALPMFSNPSCVPLKPQVHVREKLSQHSSTWTPKVIGKLQIIHVYESNRDGVTNSAPVATAAPLEMFFSSLLWFCASSFSNIHATTCWGMWWKRNQLRKIN